MADPVLEGKVRVERRFEGEKVEQGKVFYEVEYINEKGRDDYWEGVTRIHKIHYPIWPYANNVRYTLEVQLEDGMLCFNSYRIRDSWNGTGRDNLGKICVDSTGLEDIPFLMPHEIEKIQDVEDVKRFLDDIKQFIVNSATYMVEMFEPEEDVIQADTG